MSDLIERAEAIKALYKYSFVSKDVIEREIKAIPSADRPQGEWMLCDERLPDEGHMVLTTIRGHDVIIPQEGETIEEAIERIWNDVCYVSIGFVGSDGWYGADGFPQMVHPIAWMPLPKPWKGADDELV